MTVLDPNLKIKNKINHKFRYKILGNTIYTYTRYYCMRYQCTSMKSNIKSKSLLYNSDDSRV